MNKICILSQFYSLRFICKNMLSDLFIMTITAMPPVVS